MSDDFPRVWSTKKRIFFFDYDYFLEKFPHLKKRKEETYTFNGLNRNFITQDQFQQICKEEQIPIKNIDQIMIDATNQLVKEIKSLEEKVHDLKLSYFQLLKILVVVSCHIAYYIYK